MMSHQLSPQLFLGICIGILLAFIPQELFWVNSFRRHYLFKSVPNYNMDKTQCRKAVEESLSEIEEDCIAKQMYETVKVACWIPTSPETLDHKAVYARDTWTKRCNVAFFMSSVQNDSFPTIGLNVTEGYDFLPSKTMHALKFLYDSYLNDADWFLKADDDTYVIMENLRYFLSGEDPSQPVYFGQHFKPYVKQGYASGGAGYVISREALRRLGEQGFSNSSLCSPKTVFEDVEIGKCLEGLGVVLKSSLDGLNRTRFHCFSPETYLKARFPEEFYKWDYENARGGMENMSNYPISFHRLPSDRMNDMEFFVYHLRTFGILHKPLELNVRN